MLNLKSKPQNENKMKWFFHFQLCSTFFVFQLNLKNKKRNPMNNDPKDLEI